jgi:subtilisin family serine protease
MKISYLSLLLFVAALPPSQAQEADKALLKAAADGNAPRIVLSLAEAKPDIRDENGRTPLMLAAASGDFESVRRLLWAGADANLKDNDGKIAREYLDMQGDAFAPLSLIVRAYAFCQEYGRPPTKPKIPNLVLISDIWVDPFHPEIKKHYLVNEVERKGKNGVDDDKNGFVDDIYGWNFLQNEPLLAPQLSIDDTQENRKYLNKLIKDYLEASSGDEAMKDALSNRYTNPLVKQIGFGTLMAGNLDLNDYVYAEMLYGASHGTHVAGIVAKYSEGKALLHGSAIGQVTPISGRVFTDTGGLVKLAGESDDYASFVAEVVKLYRAEAIKKGRRASDYLRTCGAGVANMSWFRPKPYFEGLAEELKHIYTIHGKDPESVETKFQGEKGILLENLVLELTVADAAAFALAFYENPDVLIVIAAGNAATDNDLDLPSPCYLSRFFPNVITVASMSEAGKPSSFTNFGPRSVQIAALGENIVSPILAGLEAPMSGTSMAAPLVAGVAAGIRKDYPNLSAKDIRRLLETSVTKDKELESYVATSGVIDPAAARTMAESWSADNLAMLVEEVRAAKRGGPDGPTIKVPQIASKPAPVNPPKEKGEPYRITNVTGFSNMWRVTMSRSTPFADQRHLGVGPWPDADVKKGWDEGYRITALGGDSGGWNIVMSTGTQGAQYVVGYEFDQSTIATKISEGYRITSLAGWKNQWLVIMTTETGWGAQRFSLPTTFSAERQKWVEERWAEGYRITSIAGDDLPKDDEDGFIFVMTLDSGLQEQTFSLPGPWPEKWIEENTAKGFRVTGSAGTEDHTIVVMSKGTTLGDQVISESGIYPNEWIGKLW